jgi:hypothetical protein
MLEETKLKQLNQLKIEQKLRHSFLLQRRNTMDTPIVSVNNSNQFHIDRSKELGNHDTSTAYHAAVAQTALNMLANRFDMVEGDSHEI